MYIYTYICLIILLYYYCFCQFTLRFQFGNLVMDHESFIFPLLVTENLQWPTRTSPARDTTLNPKAEIKKKKKKTNVVHGILKRKNNC